jgi:hypothetical protein
LKRSVKEASAKLEVPLSFQICFFEVNQHKPRRYTLWLFNIAMENGKFIDGSPIKNGDFPWLC